MLATAIWRPSALTKDVAGVQVNRVDPCRPVGGPERMAVCGVDRRSVRQPHRDHRVQPAVANQVDHLARTALARNRSGSHDHVAELDVLDLFRGAVCHQDARLAGEAIGPAGIGHVVRKLAEPAEFAPGGGWNGNADDFASRIGSGIGVCAVGCGELVELASEPTPGDGQDLGRFRVSPKSSSAQPE
ncbi:hypothetical protein E1218_27550 [Kribbella turkmenica]|uniref:Uncharacterized protein n=1 Tax=Kribbella turkmenica TaxID=2530375 RepID=A0A4R4WFC9_9ACTN|nr:hypothetical protein [Kribbella turkmenica]TDD17602.1 hypothetical protein E1218_27550 [Kribbella turkmenica]